MTQLRALELWGTTLGDADLAPLRGLTQLQMLNLWGSQLTDAGLEDVGRLKNLRTLDLSDNSITDAGLVHLKELTQLRSLDLQGTQVTDAGCAQLKQALPGVAIDRTDLEKATSERVATEKIDVNRAIAERISTKQAIAVIQKRGGGTPRFTRNQKSAQISSVDLRARRDHGRRVGVPQRVNPTPDAGRSTSFASQGYGRRAGPSQRPTQLQVLDISRTKVTDAGLEHLKGLIQLKRLNLWGTKVTDAGVSELKKALPNVEIIK